MTKKAPAKPKNKPGIKAFIKRNKKYIIIGIVAIIVIIFGGYRLQIYREQRQFAQAEVVLADLSAKIQKELGPPISSSTDKSCGYASVVYGRGRRGCGVGFALDYNITMGPAMSIGRRINPIFSNDSGLIVTFNTLLDEPKYGYIGNDFKIKKNGLICGAKVRELNNFEKGFPKIIVSASCSGDAITEHFPVSD